MTRGGASPNPDPTNEDGDSNVGLLRASEDVETVQLGPNTVRFLLSGEETDGRTSLTLFTIAPPPAPAPPPHRHLDADESIYVLDGMLDCTVGEQSQRLAPGSVMHVPRETLHGLANPGPIPATILVVLSPPGFEGYWRDAARLLAQSGGQPDPKAMLELQRRYHMESGGEPRQFR